MFSYQHKELKFGTQITFGVKSKLNFQSTYEQKLIPTQLSQSQLSLATTPSLSELSLALLGLVIISLTVIIQPTKLSWVRAELSLGLAITGMKQAIWDLIFVSNPLGLRPISPLVSD